MGIGYGGFHDDDPPNYALQSANAASRAADELEELNDRLKRLEQSKRDATPQLEIFEKMAIICNDEDCANCKSPFLTPDEDDSSATSACSCCGGFYLSGFDGLAIYRQCFFNGLNINVENILKFQSHCPNWENHISKLNKQKYEYIIRLKDRIIDYEKAVNDL